MYCPECRAEVAEQAVYCHKCGQRIDVADQQSLPRGQGETESASPDSNSAEEADRAVAQPARSPIEGFKETMATRQDREDEPEEEIWQGRYSSKAMLGAWVLSGLISIGLLALAIWVGNGIVWWSAVVMVVLLWVYQLLVMKYRQWNFQYRLTNQRFIHETGILRRVTDRIEVIDMDDITFEQSLLERLVGVGAICITSSDRTHPELLLRGIEDVKDVAGKIDDIRRSERRRRGLHIESI